MQRNRIILGAIALGVIIVGAIIFWMTRQTSTPTTRPQTATVQRGNILATVSAAGNVFSPEDASLAFQTSGRVTKVNVQVGDVVKKGQVLMELDSTDQELALRTAKANLTNQQANFEATKSNLQLALRTAQANLASSQANLEAAKAKAAQLPNQLVSAKVALDKATIALQKAQSDYNAIAWRGDVGMTSQAQALQTATLDYNAALANYNITAANIANDTTLKQAQAQLERDQVALEQAQRNLDTTLRTAQAQLDSAQAAYDQAVRNLEKTKLVSPIDGVVAQVNFSVGDSAGTGVAVMVVDLSQLQVRLTVAEVDVAKIKVGQTAQMTLDALPGKTYAAKVLSVAPIATVTQGVVNYPVIVALTNNDGQVKPGMTTNVTITVEERANVLLVPLRAVRTQGNQKIVTVVYQGQNIAVPVTTGLSNDTSVEITSPGLQEGDQVLLTTTTTTTRPTGGGGGIPGGGFFIGGPGGGR